MVNLWGLLIISVIPVDVWMYSAVLSILIQMSSCENFRQNNFGKGNQKEIARELGVSQSLISKILSGKNEGSRELTETILKAVSE